MRKIKLVCVARWAPKKKYEEEIELEDGEDAEEVARFLAMEQLDWWIEEEE